MYKNETNEEEDEEGEPVEIVAVGDTNVILSSKEDMSGNEFSNPLAPFLTLVSESNVNTGESSEHKAALSTPRIEITKQGSLASRVIHDNKGQP
mmetsp:Transcript_15785/g.21370  ORF Transcript_15785/g.21370 Transcript_15785/m.21370 type:complete len:94 (+) Transcript_15785:789-1070(+)|eukprot:CAMPEP_0185596880 /NCGR_PEP_ID=MMETSP0434-20130131/81009_1 /TAXON_ID=626734 ORGANISM="Favella taraikaensis, Strain Fe Narragansett Bay" /NCGR_SAMPLE_ID=MMETSP0434 /ASSEMBLY_ACC=CAM_ASM_000379 /LENGTH=93 /DNA_ID=CAMNT_0028225445 /DNA_START=1186 /DNA_END=1467 /DNA_ORIENTATION=-